MKASGVTQMTEYRGFLNCRPLAPTVHETWPDLYSPVIKTWPNPFSHSDTPHSPSGPLEARFPCAGVCFKNGCNSLLL